MPDENDPVSPEEYVLRRIPNVGEYVDFSLPVPVTRLAFRPDRIRDKDGISVFRNSLVEPAVLAASGKKKGDYYVVRIRVQDILDLGLTVIPDPQDDQPPGHSLIPELHGSLAGQDKEAAKELQLRLAELGSQEIVYSPSDQ